MQTRPARLGGGAFQIQVVRWLPLAALPLAVCLVAWDGPAWGLAWVLALAIFFALKWVTVAGREPAVPASRRAGYLLMWPGMDAEAFLRQRCDELPSLRELFFSWLNLAGGILLLSVAVSAAYTTRAVVRGWLGLIGLGFIILFGVFQLLSLIWRQAGVRAEPIMRAPSAADSLDSYWGERWNRAFSTLASRYLYRPGIRRWGRLPTLFGVFLFSGVLHEVVISVPARGGWGFPTLYFLIQATGLAIEHSQFGRHWGLGSGLRGRLFCFAFVGIPLPLLVHRPFLERVVVPMLDAMGALAH